MYIMRKGTNKYKYFERKIITPTITLVILSIVSIEYYPFTTI